MSFSFPALKRMAGLENKNQMVNYFSLTVVFMRISVLKTKLNVDTFVIKLSFPELDE
jgi:hypothetical protein